MLKVTCFIQNECYAATHTCSKVTSCLTDYHDRTTSHVFTTMIANTFYHGCSTGVAYCKPFTSNAAEIHFTANGAIEYGITNNDVVFCDDRTIFRWIDDYTTTRN